MTSDTFVPLLDLVRARRWLRETGPAEWRRIREDAGVIRSDLAKALGVSKTSLALWETGKRNPGRTKVMRYVAALKRLDLMTRRPGGPPPEMDAWSQPQ
jgi:DNA-binding XRE family transcriptional regulator